MRRNIKGKKPKSKRKTVKLKIIKYMLILITVFALVYTYRRLYKNIMPSIFAMAQFKAKSIATDIINEAVKETIKESNINSQDLVTYDYDEKGNVNGCVLNTIKINEISSDVIKKISEKLDKVKVHTLDIPLGDLTGSNLIANYGPILKIRILPVGAATINYDREFAATGINQINHRVWLNIDTNIQIVIPLATQQISIKQKFTLVDRVFRGEVPPNYVNVPKEHILDVAPAR